MDVNLDVKFLDAILLVNKTYNWYHDGITKNQEMVFLRDGTVQRAASTPFRLKTYGGTWKVETDSTLVWSSTTGTVHRLLYNTKDSYWKLTQPVRSPPSIMKEARGKHAI